MPFRNPDRFTAMVLLNEAAVGAVRRRRRAPLGAFALALLFGALALAGGASAQDAVPSGSPDEIRPGDEIVLRIPLEKAVRDTIRVAPNGDAVLPWIGAVDVTRYTAASLPRFLRGEYARFLRDPNVDVIVLRRVGVQGEVERPDLYWVDLSMTVRDLLTYAGGLTEAADPRRIELIRGNQRIRLDPSEGAQLSTRELRSGDHIFVGRRGWLARNSVAVLGASSGLLSVAFTIVQLLR